MNLVFKDMKDSIKSESQDPLRKIAEYIERIESRNGLLTIETAEKQNIGTREYELINID